MQPVTSLAGFAGDAPVLPESIFRIFILMISFFALELVPCVLFANLIYIV